MTTPVIPGYAFRIESGEGGWYFAQVRRVNEQQWGQVGSLELFDDEDGSWVNNIEVTAAWQRCNIGAALIAAAIAANGTIYFSEAPYDNENDDADTRHCSVEGAALANSCIRKHMDVEWRTPAWARDSYSGSEGDGSQGGGSGSDGY
jgi:hypothetical protein